MQAVAARRTAAASQRVRIPGFFLDRAPQTPDWAAAPILSGHSLIFQKIDAKSKRNTVVVTWGLASGLGCLACAVLGVGLLTAIMGRVRPLLPQRWMCLSPVWSSAPAPNRSTI